MAWRWPWTKTEKRSASSGFTAELIGARASYIAGRTGIGELTATAQSCIALWENSFALGDIDGTSLIDRRALALIGRSLALRGEAVFLIGDGFLTPCSDWDLRTRLGRPSAYRVSVSEAGGGTTQTALAGEVLHFRVGSDAATPWLGSAPLRRASLTAGLLESVETALAEVYENAPLGSQIVPFPESPDVDMEALGRGFRGRRGRVMLRESTAVTAGGGPAPATDWRPSDVTPNLQQAMTAETLAAAREAIAAAFGVLPGLFYHQTTGPMVREAQRHLVQFTLQGVAALIAEEASAKLGGEVTIDLTRPLQAYDAGGRARALATLVQAAAQAKEAGIDIGPFADLVDWAE